MNTRIIIAGGDMRAVSAARKLSERFDVTLYGFDKLNGNERGGVRLYDGSGAADCLLLPVNRSGGTVKCPFGNDGEITADKLPELSAGGIVIEGSRTPEIAEFCASHGYEHIGCLEREELAVANAQLTAEGAAAAAINGTNIAVNGAEVLVLGFGRIAKLTARYLAVLGAKVTIAARKPADIAWARALGYGAADFADEGAVEDAIADSDIIMNTVPAKILTGQRERCVREHTVLIELASVPCTDDNAGFRVIKANGLPGKTAPVTAGRYIADTVTNILTERGKLYG